jgi:methenyltetrahydrofolate cyclohydrolase
MSLGNNSLNELLTALQAKTPTPGGGAAAAIAAALGCATGAMAARYTSGVKYAAVEQAAQQTADALSKTATTCVQLGDADAAAYAAVSAAKKNKDTHTIEQATRHAAQIPADLLALCAEQATHLAAFIPSCNPYLRSDVYVAIHLLAGAGRAAWQTILINQPSSELTASAKKHLAALAAAEHAIPDHA